MAGRGAVLRCENVGTGKAAQKDTLPKHQCGKMPVQKSRHGESGIENIGAEMLLPKEMVQQTFSAKTLAQKAKHRRENIVAKTSVRRKIVEGNAGHWYVAPFLVLVCTHVQPQKHSTKKADTGAMAFFRNASAKCVGAQVRYVFSCVCVYTRTATKASARYSPTGWYCEQRIVFRKWPARNGAPDLLNASNMARPPSLGANGKKQPRGCWSQGVAGLNSLGRKRLRTCIGIATQYRGCQDLANA